MRATGVNDRGWSLRWWLRKSGLGCIRRGRVVLRQGVFGSLRLRIPLQLSLMLLITQTSTQETQGFSSSRGRFEQGIFRLLQGGNDGRHICHLTWIGREGEVNGHSTNLQTRWGRRFADRRTLPSSHAGIWRCAHTAGLHAPLQLSLPWMKFLAGFGSKK